MTAQGQQEPFPPTRPNGRCWVRKRPVAIDDRQRWLLGQACMGLLVSTDLTWTPFVRSAGRVWFFKSSIINSPCWRGRWVCGRRRAFPRFSSLLGKRGEAEPVGAADRPHIHRPFLPIVPRRDQGFWVMIRGELARGGTSRHTLVFGGSIRVQTMMQSCASAAKLRDGRPIL